MNLVFLTTLSQDWNQFYDYQYDLEINRSNKRIILSQNHRVRVRVYVHDSHFKDLTSNVIAISTESNDSLLFVDLCSFSNISHNVIYYDGDGQMCIYRSCGIKCYSYDFYGFLIAYVTRSNQSQIVLNLFSISFCNKEGYHACELNGGYQQISQTNISDCALCLYLVPYNHSFIRYSTIEKSTINPSFADPIVIIQLRNDCDMDVSNCIFKENRVLYLFGLRSKGYGLYVKECVFSQNIYVDILFATDAREYTGTSITVVNCFFDDDNSISITFGSGLNGTIISPVESLDIKLKLLNIRSCLETIPHENIIPCTNCIRNPYRLKFIHRR